jgi:flavorubredoxin/flavin reductase (DIM6/NTAB) family NADH-FMN oxidoreductase RutF
MHQVSEISKGIFWVGGNDRRLFVFEGVFHVPRGVSYNSYLVMDEKTVLFDTVDKTVGKQFFENVSFVLQGRTLDYLVIQHLEPDHAAAVPELILRYPEVTIVTNKKSVALIKQFFNFDIDSRVRVVQEGDTLESGSHTFTFVMAPMVHWPEVMVTYDTTAKILFSADAFGTFGAINGNLFADEINFERDWLDDARRYYANIVGKYGKQVQDVLDKAAKLDIAAIYPLHGPVWRKNISWYLDKYQKWSTYTPEESAVMIAYASVYGNTENAVNLLAADLAERGVRNIAVYDVSVTDPSVIVSESFRCSHLVFASTTYNAGIFINMEQALLDLKAHNVCNRTVALIENGSWMPNSGTLMRNILSSMDRITIVGDTVTINSSVTPTGSESLQQLADLLVDTMPKNVVPAHNPTQEPISNAAFFKLSYGLYLLTAKDGEKDNGCIINTPMQVTDTPKRVSITVNKANFTHDLIVRSGRFNLSVLTVDAPFKLFQNFGFQSGRTVDKFASYPLSKRSINGLLYEPDRANAFISGTVIESHDYGTHTLFVADVTEAALLSNVSSLTYQYYFDNIKPKPPVAREKKKKGYLCKICGYFHEGDELPDDFVCPLCKHGAADFERVGD